MEILETFDPVFPFSHVDYPKLDYNSKTLVCSLNYTHTPFYHSTYFDILRKSSYQLSRLDGGSLLLVVLFKLFELAYTGPTVLGSSLSVGFTFISLLIIVMIWFE